MLSLHVVGELLGASGLAWPEGQQEDALSFAHMLDLLSLHPSSQRSYFCKWRLAIDAPAKAASDGAGGASWEVLQGDARGQTQVHHASNGGGLAMPTLQRQCRNSKESIAFPNMDTVWAQPIELHLAVPSAAAWQSWPRLEFQVWSLDGLQQEKLRGTASVPLPMASNEYVLDVPLVLQEPKTLLGALARAFDVFAPATESNWHTRGGGGEEVDVIQGAGTLYLRFAVLSRGFQPQQET